MVISYMNTSPSPQTRATLIGFVAIALWALLALLTAASGTMPPFQLAAICFGLAGLGGIGVGLWRGTLAQAFIQPPKVWALGIFGLFGYHFCYFTALRNAPVVEASLIAYLWPLLIVLFAACLPEGKLHIRHFVGAMLGLLGAGLLITRSKGIDFDSGATLGYVMAGLCAIIWSSYSVLSRRFADTPTDVITGYCCVSALLALLCHLGFETTQWPETTLQWLAIVGLGLGPVGLAFFVWDHGMKQGNIALLGVLSYASPLFSTLLMIMAGFAEATWTVLVACAAITLGAFIAARNGSRNDEKIP